MKSIVVSILLVVMAQSAAAEPQRGPSRLKLLQDRVNRATVPGASHLPGPQPSVEWNINLTDAVEVGGCYSVEISGDILFAGFGPMLSVFDITNPETPERIGHIVLGETVVRLLRVENYLYCGLPEHLVIMDVTTPADPTVVATIAADAYSLDVDGNYLYVDDDNDVRIYDISTPASPEPVGLCPAQRISDIEARDGFVYVSQHFVNTAGVRIIDATDPSNPFTVAVVPTGGGASGLDVDGDRVYAVNAFYPGAGLYVIDVATPAAPNVLKLVSGIDLMDVEIEGDVAFALSYDGMLSRYDVSDPANPVALAPFSGCTLGAGNDLVIAGGLAVLAGHVSSYNDGMLCVVDVSNPATPVARSTRESIPVTHDLDVAGDHLALSLDHGNLLMVNRYDPALRHFGSGGGPNVDGTNVVVRGSQAFVTMCDSWGYFPDDGLGVFDVSDPLHPVRTGVLQSGWCANHVSAGSSHVYFTAYNQLVVADVSDPAHPDDVGTLTLSVSGLVAVEPYLFVSGSGALKVFDVTNPAVPSSVATLPLGGDGSLSVLGDHAYVCVGTAVRVVDISNPLQPSLVTSIPATQTRQVLGQGQYVYLIDGSAIRIFDVSNPTTPSEVGNATIPVPCRQIAVAAPYLYVITEGPLLVYQTDLITGVPDQAMPAILRQNYPNPFNPSTTITFTLRDRGTVLLQVFDVQGRLVSGLVDEVMPAGTHAASWDGHDSAGRVSPSGVYFYRLTAGGKTESRKMVILK